MQFLLMFKVNADRVKEFSAFSKQRGKVAGINLLFDVETPTGSGAAVVDAENDEALYRWFVPIRQFFTEARIEPAMDVRRLITITQ